MSMVVEEEDHREGAWTRLVKGITWHAWGLKYEISQRG